MAKLSDLFEQHQGKVSDKWASYLPVYEEVLKPYRRKAVRLLEVGVQNGGSLEIWSKYFTKARHIVGCDIDPMCGDLTFDAPVVSVVIGDAAHPDTYDEIDRISPDFDIIIDDGSHHSADIITAFAHLFARLKDGGVYICEDLHCSYFAAFGGGLEHPDSANAFFRRLSDLVNVEHWFRADQTETPVTYYRERYGLDLPLELLSHIHEVRFFNSICVIQKRAPENNRLGQREVHGTAAGVSDDVLALKANGELDGTGLDPQEEQPQPESIERRAVHYSHHHLALVSRHDDLLRRLRELTESNDPSE